jgi:hypothetical protein
MANYMARVELHSANWNNYEVLHAAMQRRGFLRTIRANDGKVYQLPTGTYAAEKTTSSLQNALDAATAAAQETGLQAWILVADWNSASWRGLNQV